MELTPATRDVDLKKRFQKELRLLPDKINLEGDKDLVKLAELLLKSSKRVSSSKEGVLVRVIGLESYCTEWMGCFLEGSKPQSGMFLLFSIPEALLQRYAESKEIILKFSEPDDVRKMLDKIAEAQPQTYLALLRSTERLRALEDK